MRARRKVITLIDAKYEHSAYHKALHVSYPNAEDRRASSANSGVSPGGAIMIHGLPNGKGWVGARHRLFDWTLGCIAVTDEEIDEVWKLFRSAHQSRSGHS